ncbi:MAG: hypothetical protein ACRDMV_21645, partial [Streptosporangiales bacterium]
PPPHNHNLPDAVWEALAAMPALARTALVLRAYEGIDAVAVASLLRRDRDQVADAYAAGLATLASVLPGRGADARLDDLGQLLADRAAADVPLEPAPYEQVAPLLAARRKRRLVTSVAAVVVLALLAGGYAVVTTYWRPTEAQAGGSVLSWPTRGSLADDRAFLDAVERRAAGDARVLYASDLRRRRVALVLRTYPESAVSLLALEGPRGSPVDDLSASLPDASDLSGSSRIVAWADPQAPGSPLVVLATARSTVVGVSTRPRVRAGRVDRSYEPHRMHHGVYAGTAPAPSVQMMRVAVSGHTGPQYDGPVAGIDRHPFYPGTDPPRPQTSYGSPVNVTTWHGAVAEIAATYRVPYSDLDVLWRWARKVSRRTVWIAAVYRLPGGAAVLQVRWSSRDLGGGLAVNHYVRGRPVADPGAPVAWRAGDRIGVVSPGHPGRMVTLHAGPGSQQATTGPTGYASLAVPRRSDYTLTVETDSGVHVPVQPETPYDDDPLDVRSR